jgi:hypothetical protein
VVAIFAEMLILIPRTPLHFAVAGEEILEINLMAGKA